MNRQLVVILSIITLDAVGIGLIFPILPGLLREITGSSDISLLYGVMLSLYAFMQFVFSPVLGALSDRYGRRPVLLVSIAGATVDYVFMALAPLFAVLLIGRAIAGLTSANMAVATAYIADITAEDERAKRFGWMSAAFGVGFIVGPVIGGVLGDLHLRAPFVLAAALNGATLALTFFLLPESRARSVERFQLATLNPLAPMRWAFGLSIILPLLGVFTLFGLIGNIPGTVWVLYGQDKFQWNGLMVGLSLASFGIWHAGSQGLLTGPLIARVGEVRTIIIGICSDVVAFILLALATQGWVAFAISPLFALSGVAIPALQAMMSREVGEARQGELQGVLASLMSLTAIVGPLVGTFVYTYTRARWIGAVWILGAMLYVVMIPLLIADRRRWAERRI
ncbi:MAG: Tet(A)/Tet(B)/Tet(C) family tetracycline efflux MFS transporter [Gemmatimonadota bacterium]